MIPNDNQILDTLHNMTMDPTEWIAKANELIFASEILLPAVLSAWENGENMHIADTHAMITAFAIENLLKAIIVKNNPELIANELHRFKMHGGKRPGIYTHDLVDLASQAEVAELSTNADWNMFLHRLSHLIKWSGRYPTSIAVNDLHIPTPTNLDGYMALKWRTSDDLNNMRNIIRFLNEKLNTLVAEPAPPEGRGEAPRP